MRHGEKKFFFTLKNTVIKEMLIYLELSLPAVRRNSPGVKLLAYPGNRKHLDFFTVHRDRMLSSTVENQMTHSSWFYAFTWFLYK